MTLSQASADFGITKTTLNIKFKGNAETCKLHLMMAVKAEIGTSQILFPVFISAVMATHLF